MYDAIIVGGGPAGLAAAQALGRSLKSTLMLDAGEPRNAPAAHMHNFITRDGTPPAEFRRIARDEFYLYATVDAGPFPDLLRAAQCITHRSGLHPRSDHVTLGREPRASRNYRRASAVRLPSKVPRRASAS